MSDIKIFASDIDQSSIDQIDLLVSQSVFSDCKIRIMPDVHAGTGCVIGFTANLGNKVIPNVVGVDIGCGLLCINLGKVDINFELLDDIIKKNIPCGENVHTSKFDNFEKLNNIICLKYLKNKHNRFENSIGTLGGGNHFIEIDKDDNDNKYLIIHSGSRNLGKQVADYYQNLAINTLYTNDYLTTDEYKQKKKEIIKQYKNTKQEREIKSVLYELNKTYENNIPKSLCYLEKEQRDMYLHDMKICQEYATVSRQTIADIIIKIYGLNIVDSFSTIHNYIDEDNIIRKGAISAKKDENVLIPINMRDGCIIGKGKGNEDWNNSAPHGAGRLMSRSAARKNIKLDKFKNDMFGIYTTCINSSTIDESPDAYKSFDYIVDSIKPTVDILTIIKPIYNFKAN